MRWAVVTDEASTGGLVASVSGFLRMTQDTPTFRLYGSPAEKDGPPPAITSLETWREYGGPKDPDKQWVELRSAYELARAWCGDGNAVAAPADFLALLRTHPRLDGLEIIEGYAELKTNLRGERGGERNHDLLLVGRTPTETVVFGVEGKADESFDKSLAERWEEARKTIEEKKKPTNWPKRLGRLAPALLGVEPTMPDGTLNPSIAQVPYQLLSALAGTLIEAEDRGAQLAVFVAHTFKTPRTTDERIAANHAALAAFIARFADESADQIHEGQLYGPFQAHDVPSSRIPSSVEFMVGALTTDLRGGAE
jgi:hypothetical protein